MMLRHVQRKFARRLGPISMLSGSQPRSMRDVTAVRWTMISILRDTNSVKMKDIMVKFGDILI